jgi:hypothetical protein
MRWTGPRDDDVASDGVTLLHVVPPERWPWGPPDWHEGTCNLQEGGMYCDCAASSSDDGEDDNE